MTLSVEEIKFSKYKNELINSFYDHISIELHNKIHDECEKKVIYGEGDYPHIKSGSDMDQPDNIDYRMSVLGQVETIYVEFSKHQSDVKERIVEVIISSDEKRGPLIYVYSTLIDSPIKISSSNDIKEDSKKIKDVVDDISEILLSKI